MKILHLSILWILLALIPTYGLFQIQVGGGPSIDAFFGEARGYYTDYYGINVGGGLLIDHIVEPHVRFGGGILYPGTKLLSAYRILYEPSFRRLVIDRYPMSLGINIYPWANDNPRVFLGAEIGAEIITSFIHNAYSDRQEENGWGPDYGISGGVTFPMNDVEDLFLRTGIRLRYSNSTNYVVAGEVAQNNSGASSTTSSIEHLIPNTWSASLWVELIWGSSND